MLFTGLDRVQLTSVSVLLFKRGHDLIAAVALCWNYTHIARSNHTLPAPLRPDVKLLQLLMVTLLAVIPSTDDVKRCNCTAQPRTYILLH